MKASKHIALYVLLVFLELNNCLIPVNICNYILKDLSWEKHCQVELISQSKHMSMCDLVNTSISNKTCLLFGRFSYSKKYL